MHLVLTTSVANFESSTRGMTDRQLMPPNPKRGRRIRLFGLALVVHGGTCARAARAQPRAARRSFFGEIPRCNGDSVLETVYVAMAVLY